MEKENRNNERRYKKGVRKNKTKQNSKINLIKEKRENDETGY